MRTYTLDEPRTEPRRLQVGWAVPASRPVRTRWQYLRLETTIEDGVESILAVDGDLVPQDEPITAALDRLGNHDWELISVAPLSPSRLLYTFKRPIPHP